MLLRSNDYIFYPLMAALAACAIGIPLVITGADRIGVTTDIRENGITISGDRLQHLAAGEGVSTQLLRDQDNRLFARISADIERGNPNLTASAGVFDALRPYELDAIAGFDLRVIYVLRPSGEAPAETVDLGFFEDGLGQSYWTPHALEDGTGEYALTVDAPYCNPTFGWAGVWPAAEAGANSVDLYEIRIEIIANADCTDRPD
tara:strand:- start:631 stop:1242 length:612 start_codon:yes stop_codon:yes gene_type:complete